MRTLPETTKNKAFLTALRQQRKKLKVPQKVLAHELGVEPPAYCMIERGATSLKLDTFIFLCKRLNLKAEEFLT